MRTVQYHDYSNLSAKAYEDHVDMMTANHKKATRFIMEHTYSLCLHEEELKNAISKSLEHQYIVYDSGAMSHEGEDGPTTDIILSRKKTFEAASSYKGKKVAVLNFASNHSVGGFPWWSNAQEESLCHVSTLFPCILQEYETFYVPHQNAYSEGKMDHYGNDDLIFTPGVVVFKDDDPLSRMLPMERRFAVDVITCAAPSFARAPYDATRFEAMMRKRIHAILQVAKKEGVEVLILGAFGCGVYRNPPETVARLFKEQLALFHFEKVEFAIYDRNPAGGNFDSFNKVFH